MSNKILVVDDDDALREMVGLVLNAAGYATVFAADGLTAVEVFKAEETDLVLWTSCCLDNPVSRFASSCVP